MALADSSLASDSSYFASTDTAIATVNKAVHIQVHKLHVAHELKDLVDPPIPNISAINAIPTIPIIPKTAIYFAL